MSRTVAEFCDDSPDSIEALRVMESVCGPPPSDLAPRLAPAERTRIRRMCEAASVAQDHAWQRYELGRGDSARAHRGWVKLAHFRAACLRALAAG